MLKNLRNITETKMSSATMPTKKAAISSMASMKTSIALRGGASCGSGIPETGDSASDMRRRPIGVTNPPLQGALHNNGLLHKKPGGCTKTRAGLKNRAIPSQIGVDIWQ